MRDIVDVFRPTIVVVGSLRHTLICTVETATRSCAHPQEEAVFDVAPCDLGLSPLDPVSAIRRSVYVAFVRFLGVGYAICARVESRSVVRCVCKCHAPNTVGAALTIGPQRSEFSQTRKVEGLPSRSNSCRIWTSHNPLDFWHLGSIADCSRASASRQTSRVRDPNIGGTPKFIFSYRKVRINPGHGSPPLWAVGRSVPRPRNTPPPL